MTVSGMNSSSVSTLFGSIGTSKSSSSGSGLYSINFSDYASIRNGNYYKLLKQYYAGDTKKSNSSELYTDDKKKNTQLQAGAADLGKATDKLLANGSNSLFKKDSDGNYDSEAISNAVESFVKAYNSVVENASSSSNSSITSSASSMINNTRVNSRMLANVGLSIDSSTNKLELDKDTLAKADMNTVKSLFNEKGSYGYSVAVQASSIKYAAQNEASKSYNSDGTYSYNYVSGSLYSTSV